MIGELTEFLPNVARLYPNVNKSDLCFELIEVGPRIAPEFDDELTDYIAKVLSRRGVKIRVNTKVEHMEPGKIVLSDGQTIESETVVIATGVIPSPLLGPLPLEKSHKGAIVVEPTMRVKIARKYGLWAIARRFLVQPANLIPPWPSMRCAKRAFWPRT